MPWMSFQIPPSFYECPRCPANGPGCSPNSHSFSHKLSSDLLQSLQLLVDFRQIRAHILDVFHTSLNISRVLRKCRRDLGRAAFSASKQCERFAEIRGTRRTFRESEPVRDRRRAGSDHSDSASKTSRAGAKDVTEVMMRDAMMSKSAMEGPGAGR